jgi:amidase
MKLTFAPAAPHGLRNAPPGVRIRSRSAGRFPSVLFLAALLLALPACEGGMEEGPGAGPPWGTAADDFRLMEWTVAELQSAMSEGSLTSREITGLYLDRIEALDRQGPTLRSMITVNPEALAVADSLDEERRQGRVRGPLHGIPVVLKDNIDTADRMPTTAGSLALEGTIPPRDAFIVERLREEGAVLLGKANRIEWANFRSTQSSSGWSGVGGQVRNPYVLDRTPCGSSSGSGVVVSANLAPLAVGTETDGSVVCPAAATGVVGIKPTIGLVSRSGIIPIAESQDTAGPMARTVADAALLLNALVGSDPRDPATDPSSDREGHPRAVEEDYTRFLEDATLVGTRIGVVREGLTGYHPATDRLFQQAVEDLRNAGAEVVDDLALPHFGDYGEAEFTILLYEFKDGLNRYLSGLGPDARVGSLADVIAFNEAERERSMPFFGQEILLMAQEKGDLTEPEYLEALETARLAGAGIDALMEAHSLDALVAPTTTLPWAIDPVVGDHYRGASSTPAAVAGYPNITVPMGRTFELPAGISFFGRAWSEGTLLRLAQAYETISAHRTPPRFLPSLDAPGLEGGGGR